MGMQAQFPERHAIFLDVLYDAFHNLRRFDSFRNKYTLNSVAWNNARVKTLAARDPKIHQLLQGVKKMYACELAGLDTSDVGDAREHYPGEQARLG